VARRRPARRSRSALALCWLGVLALAAIAVSYVQPLRAYRSAQDDVRRRAAAVATLEEEHRTLERRLEVARTDGYVERQARKLGLVRAGEKLFIVSRRGR